MKNKLVCVTPRYCQLASQVTAILALSEKKSKISKSGDEDFDPYAANKANSSVTQLCNLNVTEL